MEVRSLIWEVAYHGRLISFICGEFRSLRGWGKYLRHRSITVDFWSRETWANYVHNASITCHETQAWCKHPAPARAGSRRALSHEKPRIENLNVVPFTLAQLEPHTAVQPSGGLENSKSSDTETIHRIIQMWRRTRTIIEHVLSQTDHANARRKYISEFHILI
jgi:hypothetical protein